MPPITVFHRQQLRIVPEGSEMRENLCGASPKSSRLFSFPCRSVLQCLLLVFLVLLAGCTMAPPPVPPLAAGHGVLTIELSGFRNDLGLARISLFTSAEGFPRQPEKAYRSQETAIVDGMTVVTFVDLPWGHYAIAALHDENEDGRMNSNWLGMPEEGYAVSNNSAGRFGAPSFTDAVFTFDTDRQIQGLTIRYRTGGPFRQ